MNAIKPMFFLVFSLLAGPSRADSAPGSCTFTCDTGEQFCAPGTRAECTSAKVAQLFAGQGLPFPRCLGRSLVFARGEECPAAAAGACTFTCDTGEAFCAPGRLSECTGEGIAALFEDQGLAFPRCLGEISFERGASCR